MSVRISLDDLFGRGVDRDRLPQALQLSLRSPGTEDLTEAGTGPPAPTGGKAPRTLQAAMDAADAQRAAEAARGRPGGTLVAVVHVRQRPLPWSVPYIKGKRTTKNKPLEGWQAAVAACARVAMDGRPPHAGPYRIMMKFALRPSRNGSVPDWVNMAKGAEDALQGIVIDNDRQGCIGYVERWASNRNYAVLRVEAIDRLVEIVPERYQI